jgi:hypothetical protein
LFPFEALNSNDVLPLWFDGVLALASIAAGVRAWRLHGRVRDLTARLQSREREGHFLAESPDPQQILQHAYRAASEILPLSAFDLYRVDQSQRIHEVWILGGPAEDRRPRRDPANPHLGALIDSKALLEFAATETDRSFPPSTCTSRSIRGTCSSPTCC